MTLSAIGGKGEIEPNAVLELAKNEGLDQVVVVGYDKEGALCVWGSSMNADTNHWLLSKGANFFLNEAKLEYMPVKDRP